MFTLFRQNGRHPMTVVAGVALYEATLCLPVQEMAAVCADGACAIVLPREVATRTAAYANLRVSPPIL